MPLSAVSKKGDRSFVQKIENNKPKKIEITSGLETDENIEIQKGLLLGDEVALKFQP